MKYLVEKFYFDSGSLILNLPDGYEPVGYDGNYVIAKKLIAQDVLGTKHDTRTSSDDQMDPDYEYPPQVKWTTDEYWRRHAKQLITHWDGFEEVGGKDVSPPCEPDVPYDGSYHPDDLDYVKPEEEPLTINPVDRIMLENLVKEYAWEDEQRTSTEQGGVFRHCEECDNIETIYPIEGSYGMFTSSLDFCTRCEKPWGMGMEKDAWAEGQMMPGMREGIKIEAPDPIDYRCILCSYKSEDFATTGAECDVDEDGMHDWMLAEEYWDMIVEHQDANFEFVGEEREIGVYKPCIFCKQPFESHNQNTHWYEPRERCKWCTLDEHKHNAFMHRYEALTEPGPNRGYCVSCGSFNDKHSTWCMAIPKRVKAQRVCPVGFHDDISMHLCQCSAADETHMPNTNTGYTANVTPAHRQLTDEQMRVSSVDGGRDANAKAYAEQYGTGTKSRAVAEILAAEAQRGDSPKVRCPSCQRDQMECFCA